MKKYSIFAIVLLLFSLGLSGCDEHGVYDPTQIASPYILPFELDADADVQIFTSEITGEQIYLIKPVPDYVFDVAMKPWREYVMALWERHYNIPAENFFMNGNGHPDHVTEHLAWQRALEDKFGQKPVVNFDILSLQKEFYARCAIADGMVVVANNAVRNELSDNLLWRCAEAMLVMTSKHRMLREGHRMEDGFYSIVFDGDKKLRDPNKPFDPLEITSYQFGDVPTVVGKSASSCNEVRCITGVFGAGDDDSTRLSTFIHEFAHTLDREITAIDPEFPGKVKIAFDTALERYEEEGHSAYTDAVGWGKSTNNPREYWATGVATWFTEVNTYHKYVRTFYTYEEWQEKDPLLYDLLLEWFPQVSLASCVPEIVCLYENPDGTRVILRHNPDGTMYIVEDEE